MENIEERINACSKNYGMIIVELLYNQPCSHRELCAFLNLEATELTVIMNKMEKANLITRTNVGKFVYYQLNAEILEFLTTYILQDSFKEDKIQEMQNFRVNLNKVAFFNLLKGQEDKEFVSFLKVNVDVILQSFSFQELMILLYILDIHTYPEGENITDFFGVDHKESIDIKRNVMEKFKNLLIHRLDYIVEDESKRSV